MKLSARIKLLFGSTKCSVRGYHECASGDWQEASGYGKDFFSIHCDGCSHNLISIIRDPIKPMSRIVLTRWWGREYPAEDFATTHTFGLTATTSTTPNGQVWNVSMSPPPKQKAQAKKKPKAKKAGAK